MRDKNFDKFAMGQIRPILTETSAIAFYAISFHEPKDERGIRTDHHIAVDNGYPEGEHLKILLSYIANYVLPSVFKDYENRFDEMKKIVETFDNNWFQEKKTNAS